MPGIVGPLLSGIMIGPHGLGFFGGYQPIATSMAELGQLLLVLFAGLSLNPNHLGQINEAVFCNRRFDLLKLRLFEITATRSSKTCVKVSSSRSP